jgi:hypothetical protein
MPDAPAGGLQPYRTRLTAALAQVTGAGAGAGPDAGAGTARAALEALESAGLGDGLPVVPLTASGVAALLDGRDPGAPALSGPLPISFAVPTWWELAVTAVLAGCPPGSLPLVAAALDAMTDPAFNLLGVQTTTGAAAPLVVVHGQAAAAFGLNAAANALGPGFRANVTIGRAVRLALADIGCCRPGEADMATHGHPGKIAWLVAENRPASPWAPFRPAAGGSTGPGAGEEGAVTVMAGVGNVEVVLPTTSVADVVGVLSRVLVGLDAPRALLLLPPESAWFLHRHGLTGDKLQGELAERGARPPLILVTGGAGTKATVVPGWGGPSEPVTRAVDLGSR